MSKRSRVFGVALVMLAAGLWSTSGVFITLVLRGSRLTPTGLAFWRDLGTFACLLVGVIALRRELLRVSLSDVPTLAAMGAIGIGLLHATWNSSVLVNGVSVASVIQQANTPIFVAVMARLLWREPLTWRKLFAISLAVVGTILVSRLDRLGGMRITLMGLALGLLSAVTNGAFSLFGKKLTGDYSPWTVLLYVFGFGTLTLLPFQVGGPALWPVPWAVLGYYTGLMLLTTVTAYAAYTNGLRRLPASVATVVATAELPFAAFMSYLLLHERLDAWQVLGAVLVACGIVLISLPQQVRRAGPSLAAGPCEDSLSV